MSIAFFGNIKPKTDDPTNFVGIINHYSKSVIIIGPQNDPNVILSKLQLEVDKLMQNPRTELVPSDDSAIVYEIMDGELVVYDKIDIGAILEEDE